MPGRIHALVRPDNLIRDTKSAGDKSAGDRRNVRENVDAAVNPCRKFFELEIKARLIASALHELGMNNLSDRPTGEFCQPNLPEASDIEKKEYLHKVASRIVDSYVIRRENLESIFNSLLAAEEEEASNRRNQTDDGRFICNFLDVETLSKSMASDCGIMNQPTTHQSQPLILNSHSFQERGCLLCLFLKRMTCLITNVPS